jgi:arylsulfatase
LPWSLYELATARYRCLISCRVQALLPFCRRSIPVKPLRLLAAALILVCAGCGSDDGSSDQGLGQDLNVLVIVVDTMAARHLGCFTPGLDCSPTIDRLAAEGAHFTHAYSTAPWTQPAVASLFTSQLPSDAGVTRMFSTLPDSLLTLAEVMRQSGRWSMGVTSNWIVTDEYGFGQGFEKLNDSPVAGHDAITDGDVTDAGLLILDRVGKRPFYLYLHYFDPHWYFNHHPQFDRTSGYTGRLEPGMDIDDLLRDRHELTAEDLEYLRDLYREEIAFTDHQISRVLTRLDELGLRENTLVVLTADHGEAFMEHDWIGHTANLYDELIHVPLIFHLPGKIAARTVETPVTLMDVLPTLADVIGAPTAGQPWRGRSLLGEITGAGGQDSPRALLAEVSYVSPDGWPSGDGQTKRFFSTSVRLRDTKVIHDLQDGRWEIYDLATDPLERTNRWDDGISLQDDLKELLESWEQVRGQGGEVRQNLDPETVRKLRSLGYVH